MEIKGIPFKKTGYFSDLICDYLEGKDSLGPLFNRRPTMDGFSGQIREKSGFPMENRKALVQVLEDQYGNTRISEATSANISLLGKETSFTVVTGHQLNLFTGPLYFLYKIITTLNLAGELKQANPENNFVPIYWMATEDHDFEEINYFNFRGKKLQWNKKVSGAVGPMGTEGLEAIWEAFSNEMGNSVSATKLKEWFRHAYLEHDNLADATRFLANELFGEYGLVILDGNDARLKKLLVPYVKKELLENTSYKKVMDTVDRLQEFPENYEIQVNPREINYFYLFEDVRERIVREADRYYVLGTGIQFSRAGILEELENHPERFSPNVITRPLYQEVVLPNLCYVGGGGELAYWLQLKAMFNAMEVPFPILLLRNSALIITQKQSDKLERLGISDADLFLGQSSFINKKIREISNIDIDLGPQRKYLTEQFKTLYTLAKETDPTFLGAVKAQEVKQLKGLVHLEKRLLKAQKKKLEDQVKRMAEIQNQLFPNRSLQERNLNFSELYLEYGDSLIPHLIQALKPLAGDFTVIRMD